MRSTQYAQHPPRYLDLIPNHLREVEYADFLSQKGMRRSSSALNAFGGFSSHANKKVEKDDFGYVFVKPTQTTSVLREVILAQKDKITQLEQE